MQAATATFRSNKCTQAIPHHDGLIKDLLIQLTLDPRVVRIGYLETAVAEGRRVGVHAITVDRVDGRFVIDVESCRPPRSLEQDALFHHAIAELGFRIMTLTGEDIMSEPKFSTARSIWANRRVHVGSQMCMALAQALEDGPITLGELCTMVSGPQEPVAAVMSLVCACYLEIDPAEWSGRATIVRSRA